MSKMADFLPEAMKAVWEEETITLKEAQEAAEKMIYESGTLHQNVRITFRLVRWSEKGMQIIPCTWYDPSLGFFRIDGVEKLTRVKEAVQAYPDFRVMKKQTIESDKR